MTVAQVLVVSLTAEIGVASHAAAEDSFSAAGSASCRPCHERKFSAWSRSLHAAAMRPASAFGGESALRGLASFGKNSRSSVEFSAGGVTVTEPGAASRTLEVRHLFGRRPMIQPLISTERGRLQALPVAWDTAKQEWFDVFSGEERLAGEFGHWTGRGMTANSQCIACHSTEFRKNYDAEADAYASIWAESGAGCEACHGPGAAHVADPKQPYGPFGSKAGIAAHHPKPAASGAASSSPPSAAPSPPASAAMLDVCATCHSVRRDLAEGFRPGHSLLDYFEPDLLDADLYHADGQVSTEAYEWGSYVQSRMHAARVSCLACHDVHSGGLRETGNGLCTSCHEPKYAEAAHTGHRAGSAGSACVDCHMPEQTFMGRDRRRDHRLGVPDPIAAKELSIPSACESCHATRGRDTLIADAVRLWPALGGEKYGKRRSIARTIAAAREGSPEAADALRSCIRGETCDTPVLRASAARLAARLPLDDPMLGTLVEALAGADGLLRSAAAFALADADPRDPLLRQRLLDAAADPLLAVRLGAAWALRRVDAERLPEDKARVLAAALAEWKRSTMLAADAPETWHTLGVFEADQRRPKDAEAAYRKAIAMEPRSVPSRHNLAMLLVAEGRIADAKKELEELVAIDDTFAPALCALGAIHGEEKNWQEAARVLGRCLKVDPDYPGALADLTHAYLEAGVPNVARTVLSGALGYPPQRGEALIGLVRVALATGDRAEAAEAARRLVAEDPEAARDPRIAELMGGAENSGASGAPAAP